MAENLIIRPARRWVIAQLAGLVLVGAVMILGGWLFGRPEHVGLILIISMSLVALAIGSYVWWMLSRAPHAILLDRTHLAILHRDRRRTYVPWEAISSATHRTTAMLGMRWPINAGGRQVVLRDIGVDPDRWALLWRRVASEASQRDARVRVDRLSSTLFEDVP